MNKSLLLLSLLLCGMASAQVEAPLTPAAINHQFFQTSPSEQVVEPSIGTVYVQTNDPLTRQVINWFAQRLGVPLTTSQGQRLPLSRVLRDLCRQNRDNDVGAVACPIGKIYGTGLEYVQSIRGESVDAANAVLNAVTTYTLQQTANFVQNNLLRGTPLGGKDMQGITAAVEGLNDWLVDTRKRLQNLGSAESQDVERFLEEAVAGRRALPPVGTRVPTNQFGEIVAAQTGVLERAMAAGQSDLKERLERGSNGLMADSKQEKEMPSGAILESEARDEERKSRDRLALAVSSRAALQVGFETMGRNGVLQAQAANYQLQAMRRMVEEQSRTTQMLGIVAKTILSQMDDALSEANAKQREEVNRIINESMTASIEVGAFARDTEQRLQTMQTNPDTIFGDLGSY